MHRFRKKNFGLYGTRRDISVYIPTEEEVYCFAKDTAYHREPFLTIMKCCVEKKGVRYTNLLDTICA